MRSNEPLLPNQETGENLADVSDVTDLWDAGENVATTLAPPAGCRTDEAKPETSEQTQSAADDADHAGCRPAEADAEPAEAADEGFLSETAQGGASGNSQNEPKTPAQSIKSRRDFEAFLRTSGFSRAVSKAIANSGWPEDGETETDDDGPISEALLKATIDLFKI